MNPYAHQLGQGHEILWEDRRSNMFWTHPGHTHWFPVDVTSGTRHQVIEGTPDDMSNLTIAGPFGCPDCGVRGSVRHGRWVPMDD
jgi:hypothetical protein